MNDIFCVTFIWSRFRCGNIIAIMEKSVPNISRAYQAENYIIVGLKITLPYKTSSSQHQSIEVHDSTF